MKDSMNPKKEEAKTPPSSSKEQGEEEEEWQPNGPCRFNQLPETLAMDILSRLTIKTLLKCRCVCKFWLSIISDPHFARLHLSRSPTGILIRNITYTRDREKLKFTQIQERDGSDFWVEKIKFTPENRLPSSRIDMVNSCNGLLCLTQDDAFMNNTLYVCNPILGEFITIQPNNKGKRRRRRRRRFVALGFCNSTNEYKVVQTTPCNKVWGDDEAEIYTIGTGVWRSLGNVPDDLVDDLPLNAFLNGVLHWVSIDFETFWPIRSFNFKSEQFRALPPPSYFGPQEMEYTAHLGLGVLEGCLLLCVLGDDYIKFDLWVMKEYGVRESWTKNLVIENLHPRQLSCDRYEPIMFLRDARILISHNGRAVVCYNQHVISLRQARINGNEAEVHAIGYSPCFVSLRDVSEVEEVKRVRGSEKSEKLFAKGSDDCDESGMPPPKSAKLNSSHGCPAFEEDPPPRATTTPVSLDFTLRMGTACAQCGADLGYVFRGKGFPLCEQCFDAGGGSS